MKRFRGRLGSVLIVLGVVALIYGATIYFWRDPVTDLYARYRQHQLSAQLDKEFARWQAQEPQTLPTSTGSSDTAASSAAQEKAISSAARRFYDSLKPGEALGRIVIPKIGIDPVFVNGTDWGSDLSRGPGRYEQTFVPGLGKVTAIAGHRTTFGAPFRNIDDLKQGDRIMLELPYGTFDYRVVRHEIVKSNDWSILKPPSYDELVLSACHPLYSASHRWIVFARLAQVELPDGQTYRPPDATHAVAAGAQADS